MCGGAVVDVATDWTGATSILQDRDGEKESIRVSIVVFHHH
jgi:hypothetical protein